MKKLSPYITGIAGIWSVILGIVFLAAPKGVCITLATAALCLVLAFGIMIPNPFSIITLIASICMLVLPPWVVGIIFIILGIAVAVLNIPAKTKAQASV